MSDARRSTSDSSLSGVSGSLSAIGDGDWGSSFATVIGDGTSFGAAIGDGSGDCLTTSSLIGGDGEGGSCS